MKEKETSNRRERPRGSSTLAKYKLGEYAGLLNKCWINQLFVSLSFGSEVLGWRHRFTLLKGASTISTTYTWGIWEDEDKGKEEKGKVSHMLLWLSPASGLRTSYINRALFARHSVPHLIFPARPWERYNGGLHCRDEACGARQG